MSGYLKKTPRLTIRVSESQMQVLRELKEALNISYSLLTRTMVYAFLKQNDELLQDIIDGKKKVNFNSLINDEMDDDDADN